MARAKQIATGTKHFEEKKAREALRLLKKQKRREKKKNNII